MFKAINLTALPQENGRWACALSSPLISKSILVYGNTKAETVSLALRELATKIEINGITD